MRRYLLLYLATLTAAGCFESLDKTTINCSTSEHCPSGYVCAKKPGAAEGLCQKAGLDGGLDVVTDGPGIDQGHADGNAGNVGLDAGRDTELDVPVSPPDAPESKVDAPESKLDAPVDPPISTDAAGGGPDLAANHCSPNPCQNGGACTNTATGYSCACVNAFGTRCETKIFEGLGVMSGYEMSRIGIGWDGTSVVGWGSTSGGGDTAFRWTSSGVALLPAPAGATNYYAHAIAGSMVVGSADGHPAYWLLDQNQNGLLLGFQKDGTVPDGQANAISRDQTAVVGCITRGTDSWAVKWDGTTGLAGRIDGTGTGAAVGACATGVSSDGKVAAGYFNDGAFRYDDGTFRPLPCSSTHAYAKAVSGDGNVVVGDCDGSAVRWIGTEGPYSVVSSTATAMATAVNSDGSVIVGFRYDSKEGFVWDLTNGARPLSSVLTAAGASLSGWSYFYVFAVSANGKVLAGVGDHSGAAEAWIARLP